jgi:cytochrome c556
MNKKLFGSCIALALGAGCALTAVAQVKPDVLVGQRQAVMKLQGKYFGPLVGMLKGTVPYNAEIVQRNAGYLDVLDKMPWDGFVESTKGEPSTWALPTVYDEPAKFKQAQEQLQSAVSQLVTVSKGGDEAAVKAAIGNVGKACGNCHDNFRKK